MNSARENLTLTTIISRLLLVSLLGTALVGCKSGFGHANDWQLDPIDHPANDGVKTDILNSGTNDATSLQDWLSVLEQQIQLTPEQAFEQLQQRQTQTQSSGSKVTASSAARSLSPELNRSEPVADVAQKLPSSVVAEPIPINEPQQRSPQALSQQPSSDLAERPTRVQTGTTIARFKYLLLQQQSGQRHGWIVARDGFRQLLQQFPHSQLQGLLLLLQAHNQTLINHHQRMQKINQQLEQSQRLLQQANLQQQRSQDKADQLEAKINALTNLERSLKGRKTDPPSIRQEDSNRPANP